MDREAEEQWAEWITLLTSTLRYDSLTTKGQERGRTVALVDEEVDFRHPLQNLLQHVVSGDGIESILEIQLHQNTRAPMCSMHVSPHGVDNSFCTAFCPKAELMRPEFPTNPKMHSSAGDFGD